jgi:tetratricopeptide (TPR) repeat protein/transglutaminase-like putative cysteine protease
VLSRIHDLEPALKDLSKVARAYQEIADDPRAHPEVRSLARWRLAGLDQARGNLRRAEAEFAKLGFVRGFFIAGPFDNEGRRGLDTSFPPEGTVDLDARYPGKAREVGWRALPPEAQPRGILALGATLRPEREVAVYALAVLDSPREQRARLWLGASGAIRAWMNGKSVVSETAYHAARLDQVGVEVTLRRGPNRLLVKLCHDQGEPLLIVRLTDRSGRALDLKASALRPLPALAPGPDPHPQRIPPLLEALERRASGLHGEREGRARMDLAIALAEKRADDSGDHRAAREARRAAELLPKSSQAQLLAARLEDEDPNRGRERVEAALAAEPGSAEASLALAEYEMRRGRPHTAVRLLEPVVAANSGYAAARATLAQAWEQVGLSSRAQLELLRLGAEMPDLPLAVEAASRAARRLERSDEAVRLLRKLLALRYDDGVARAALAQLLLDRADLEGALEQLAQAQRLDPADVWLRLRRADLLAANGGQEEAEAEYQTAARICPEEPDVYERRGRSRLRDGRRGEALADLQHALDLKPQSPQLKELVRQLQPERERFETPYVVDAAALAKAAPAPEHDEDAVVLSELKVTRVYPSGLSATYVQQVVKVFTSRGAEALRSQALGYAPGRQDIRVERARIWKPDGSAVEIHQEADHSTSEPWYRLYYDTRARVVSFPALAAGDVFELAWRSDDVASENLLSDYFGEVVPFADSVRKLEVRYVLIAPQGRRIYSNEVALPGLEHGEKLLAGGVREHRWTVRNLPRVDVEMGMPGPGEGGRYVHVSTYPSWAEVGRFYEGLVREQLKPGPEVRAAAQRIAAEVKGRDGAASRSDEELRRELVRAVYDYVVTNVRYVGLEFGIHGYKPYQVDQILSRRFGDCKDKASLMHALLEVLGVDSRLVLLRMHRLGAIPEKPASLAVFNHAILYVPEFDLWLDGTATGSGSRELPAEDRGATVLVLNPGSAPTFTVIPDSRPEDNRQESEYRLVIGTDGSAKVAGTSRVSGVQASGHRRAFQAQSERRSALEQALSSTFPGMRVDSVEVSDPSRIEGDVALTFRLSVPRFARVDEGGLSLPPFGQRAPWTERYAPLSTREHDLVLGQPFESHLVMRFALPPGLAPADLPAAQAEDTPFGSYRISIRAQGGDLVAESVVRITVSRIRAADYSAFRDLLSRIDGALSRAVRLVPAGGIAPAGRQL